MTTHDPLHSPNYQTPPMGDPHHGSVGHVVPFKVLAGVFGALIFLTVVTVLASTVNFGELNLVVALAIAVLKAALVVLYFMHLRWDKPFNSIVFIGCLIFVGLFISLALLDSYQYRNSVLPGQAPGVTHKPLQAPANPH
jgi:cytochrome c oxidase subunit 4